MFAKYNNLPEWLRWILFLPVSGLVAFVAWSLWYLGNVIVTPSYHNLSWFFELFGPMVAYGLLVYSIYITIPRAKLAVVKVMVGFRIISLAAAVLLFIYTTFSIFRDLHVLASIRLIAEEGLLTGIISESLTVYASIVIYKHYKSEQKEKDKASAKGEIDSIFLE